MFLSRLVPRWPLFLLLLGPSTAFAEVTAPATSWVPQDAVILIEVTQPKEVISRAFSEDIVRTVTALPAYQQQAAKPGSQQAINLVRYFEGQYDVDFPTLLGKLTGGGITWALGPGERSLLIVDAEDTKVLNGIHEFLLMVTKNEAQQQGDPGRVASADYRGVTGWRLGPDNVHAIIDNRLIITNKPEALKTALDLRDGEGGASMADLTAYRTASDAVDAESVAKLFVNATALKTLPQLDNVLNRNENPLGTLLGAPLLGALREASWLSMGLKVEQQGLSLDMAMDGAVTDPESPEGFACPQEPGDGAMPNLTVPRQIAAMSFYRDLGRFYTAKDELFPERTSGIIFFENMMGIFFTGRELTEEVLAQAEPDIRLVVAKQQYDPQTGTPGMQLPGFAIVFRMKDRQKFAPIAEEAWQKALGLINFTRGQQALPGLILERPTHADTKYTMSYFTPSEESDESAVHLRYNFQPSLAMPENYLILSSCDALTKDLIDAVKHEQDEGTAPLANTHSVTELNGTQLASILKANWETLVQQNMVNDGNTREEAESQLGLFLKGLEHVRRVALRAGTTGDQFRMNMQLDVELP